MREISGSRERPAFLMKRLLTVAIFCLGIGLVEACPPPTGHCIINIGGSYDYFLYQKHTIDHLRFGWKLGYEMSNRYVTFAAIGNGNKYAWKIGGQIDVNPLGIAYGYYSPINFSINIGSGYRSDYKAYISTGIEVTGPMGWYISPFLSCNFEASNLLNIDKVYNINMQVGVRLWLGKQW